MTNIQAELNTNKKVPVELGSVQKTLLLPLWGRAIEARKKEPLLIDRTAIEIINKLDYDFSANPHGNNLTCGFNRLEVKFAFPIKIAGFFAAFWPVAAPLGNDWCFHPVKTGDVWLDVQYGTVVVGVNVCQSYNSVFPVYIGHLSAGKRQGVGAFRRTGGKCAKNRGTMGIGVFFRKFGP